MTDPQLVPSKEELRPTVLMAMDMALGRTAILKKSMELLKGRANPSLVLEIIDEELRTKP